MTIKSFSELKKSSKDSLEKLSAELQKLNKPATTITEDDRFWYPAVDKAGNGSALIRFLPPVANEDVPYVRLFKHSFQGPTGSWYIENSLTTLGQEDPVSKYNSELWNSGSEHDKELARKQKRKTEYISNIYVIKDPANPENEGKVFLFRYGKKIFDKINDLMNPPEDGIEEVESINPFDLWEGANFKFVITQKSGYRNYDDSKFLTAGPLDKNDEKLEAIWKSQYPLQEFLDPKNFKSYDALKERLVRVLGLNSATPRKAEKELPVAESKDLPWKDADPIASDDGEDELGSGFFKALSQED